MRKQYMTINGCDFELVSPSYYLTCFRWYDINEAYGKPSQAKLDVYEGWYNFFYDTRDNEIDYVYDFGILSRSCMLFTIGANIKIGDTLYSVKITKEHRYIWEVRDV